MVEQVAGEETAVLSVVHHVAISLREARPARLGIEWREREA
jgi:hypothetical protein